MALRADNENKKVESETLYSKKVNKMSSNGSRQTGNWIVETKNFNGSKFVQITQNKFAFGTNAGRRSFITLDPENTELMKVLSEATKK